MRKLLYTALVMAACLGAWFGVRRTAAAHPPLQLLVHFHGGVNESALPIYKELLSRAPGAVELLAVVSSDRDAGALRAALDDRPGLKILNVRGPLSPWARDRYLLFERQGRTVCLAPLREEIPRHLSGDAEVPDALRAADPQIEVIRSALTPIGGDTLILDDCVLIGRGSLEAASRRSGLGREAVRGRLGVLFGRRLLVVGGDGGTLPRSHIDLFLADAGRGRILVADPRRAIALLGEDLPRLHPAVRFDLEQNRRFAEGLDVVSKELADAGLEVHRIPGLFAEPGSADHEGATVTYTNVEHVRRTVFLPHYGIPALDVAARTTWQDLGYLCAPVNVRGTILNGGAVRCVTNRRVGPAAKP